MQKVNLKKYYNDTYSTEKYPYGLKPNSTVKALLKFVSSGKVLDLGAGYGKDSLYLASKGFKVFALDFSPVAIGQLQELAKKLKIKLNARSSNILKAKWPQGANIFINIYTMHHFPDRMGRNYLKRIHNTTPKNGYNVIKAMMRKGQLYEKNKKLKRASFMLKKGELRKIYEGWKILKYKESNDPDKKKVSNYVAEIIAQKINDY